MGTWEELDIEFNVNLDLSVIDDGINRAESLDDCFSPVVEILNQFKSDIEEGVKNGSQEIAERTKSIQEEIISANGSVASGQLLGSIEIEQNSDYNYTIGTTIEDFYPLVVEKGRGAVVPVNAKYLHFYVDGSEVFTKYSSPSEPRPFVEPTFMRIENEAIDIIRGNLSNVTD